MDTLYRTTNSLNEESRDIYNIANTIAEDIAKSIKDQINSFNW